MRIGWGAMLAALPWVAGGAAPAARNPLGAAGFVVKRADTPARAAMLLRLPPHRFLRHYGGRLVGFAYADPGGCDCLYLGTGHAFRRYARRLDAWPAVDDHRDLLWDWDAWGAVRPGFRWGPALGW